MSGIPTYATNSASKSSSKNNSKPSNINPKSKNPSLILKPTQPETSSSNTRNVPRAKTSAKNPPPLRMPAPITSKYLQPPGVTPQAKTNIHPPMVNSLNRQKSLVTNNPCTRLTQTKSQRVQPDKKTNNNSFSLQRSSTKQMVPSQRMTSQRNLTQHRPAVSHRKSNFQTL